MNLKKMFLMLATGFIVINMFGCKSSNVEENTNADTEMPIEQTENKVSADFDNLGAEIVNSWDMSAISWSVDEVTVNGMDYIMYSYTNNTSYKIMDVEMIFKQREDITPEQLSVFNKEKEAYKWTDEEISKIYVLGYNRKTVEPGETSTGSPCVLNGTYIPATLEQYALMEPDSVTIAIVHGGKGYSINYNFKTQKALDLSNGGKELYDWPDGELVDMVPKPEFEIVDTTSNDGSLLSYDIYGVTFSDYNAYVDQCKQKGFTNAVNISESRVELTNDRGYDITISYSDDEETIHVQLSALEVDNSIE